MFSMEKVTNSGFDETSVLRNLFENTLPKKTK